MRGFIFWILAAAIYFGIVYVTSWALMEVIDLFF